MRRAVYAVQTEVNIIADFRRWCRQVSGLSIISYSGINEREFVFQTQPTSYLAEANECGQMLPHMVHIRLSEQALNLYHHTQTIIIEYTQLISKWGGRMDSMSLHSILSYESQLHGIFLRGLWSQVSAAPIHSCGGSPSPHILLQHETVTVGSQHLLFTK